MTTVTPRISGTPTVDSTRRVATSGGSGGSSASIGGDTWGGTWGTTWGRTWHTAAAAVPASGAKPEGTPTPRVSGAPSSTVTKRVTL